MPVWYEIHFEETGEKVDWYGVAGYYYIFEDGSKLEFLIAPAWCVHCQGIVGVEPMPSLSDLENYLDELLNPNSQINQWCSEIHKRRDELSRDLNMPVPPEILERDQSVFEEHLRQAKLEIQWRTNRHSPPKCLECGSTEVMVDDDNGIQTPNRGRVILKGMGWCSTAFADRAYTPEGDRISDSPSSSNIPEGCQRLAGG